MIRHLLLLFCVLTLSVFAGSAHYTLHTVSGDVKVETGGKTVPATKGMTVKAIDYIVIPQGGKVEILNDLDKRIYTSITPGRISVTKLMIAARGAAADNSANVAARMSIGRKQGADNKNVYVEKGMVRRSLAVYDPDGDMMEMDAGTLGRFVASRILGLQQQAAEDSPVKLESRRLDTGGLSFRLENTLQFPIYFNVLRIINNSTTAGNPGVEISQLGQPAGSYVVLPQQTLAREHFPAVPEGESHIIVMTNCQYDVDKVIEEITKAISEPSAATAPKDLPVYISPL